MSDWLNMSVGILSETIIANGVVSPISMVSFPSMETLQPDGITGQPDIAGPQIEIRATNDPDEFDTIPDVTVRNHYWPSPPAPEPPPPAPEPQLSAVEVPLFHLDKLHSLTLTR